MLAKEITEILYLPSNVCKASRIVVKFPRTNEEGPTLVRVSLDCK